MTQVITGQSVFALVDGHRMHVYQTGIEGGPKLVFMSGSGTVSPVHDFKILYQELAREEAAHARMIRSLLEQM